MVPIKLPKKIHDPAKISAAIEAVMSGAQSQRKAAKVFGIPYTTLNDKMTGRSSISRMSRTLLTPTEENQLADWVLQSAQLGLDRTATEVKQVAGQILGARNVQTKGKEQIPTVSWIKGFYKRHPQLPKRCSRSVRKERPAQDSLPFLNPVAVDVDIHTPLDTEITDAVPPPPTEDAFPIADHSTPLQQMLSPLLGPVYTCNQLSALKDLGLFIYDELGRNQFIAYFQKLGTSASDSDDEDLCPVKFKKFKDLAHSVLTGCVTHKDPQEKATVSAEDMPNFSSKGKGKGKRTRPTIPYTASGSGSEFQEILDWKKKEEKKQLEKQKVEERKQLDKERLQRKTIREENKRKREEKRERLKMKREEKRHQKEELEQLKQDKEVMKTKELVVVIQQQEESGGDGDNRQLDTEK